LWKYRGAGVWIVEFPAGFCREDAKSAKKFKSKLECSFLVVLASPSFLRVLRALGGFVVKNHGLVSRIERPSIEEAGLISWSRDQNGSKKDHLAVFLWFGLGRRHHISISGMPRAVFGELRDSVAFIRRQISVYFAGRGESIDRTGLRVGRIDTDKARLAPLPGLTSFMRQLR
jgi:hypothetical protein